MATDPTRGMFLQDRSYRYLVAFLPFALVGAVVAAMDPLALAVVLALPLIPFAMFALIKGMTGDKAYGVVLSVIVVCVLAANFRNRAYADKDIDFQVAMKLCAIAGLFAMSLPYLRKTFDTLHIYALLSWLLFFLYTMVTCAYTINSPPALVAVASLLGAFLFVCYLSARYGRDGAVSIVVAAGAVLWVGSLAVYFAVPELGRMSDWIGTDFVTTWRLQGLFGSSNAAGASAASGLFLVGAFYKRQSGHSRALAAVAGSSALACLILSNNRMAMFALAASIAAVYVLHKAFAKRALLLVTGSLFAVSCVVMFAEPLLAMISRSGSDDEIMSATGRTRIWSVVIDLWSQTPMMGRGFGSALYILPVHPDLFQAAAHAHSLYLEQLFSGGIIGLGLFVSSILLTMVLAWSTKAARECALLIFFLIYGLTEPVISGPVSFPLFIMFLAAVLILQSARLRSRGTEVRRIAYGNTPPHSPAQA